jgi:hypothetical protein
MGQLQRYDIGLYPVEQILQEDRAIFIPMNNTKHEKGVRRHASDINIFLKNWPMKSVIWQ